MTKGIIRISDAASIALRAMAFLSANGGVAKIPDVADAIGASKNHLAKIFALLVSKGLVSSERGPAGGIRLVRPGREISLASVYDAVEEPCGSDACDPDVGPPGACLLGKRGCSFRECLFRPFIGETQRRFRAVLESHFLPDLSGVGDGSGGAGGETDGVPDAGSPATEGKRVSRKDGGDLC